MATRIPRWLVHAPLLIDMLLVALAAAATVRLLAVPGFPRTDDGDFHLFRLADLVTVLGEGSWYPRWSPSMALGYGYPLYNFYPPLSSWSAAIFYLIGFSTVDAARAALVIPVVVAGWGMYGFTRADHGRAGALVAGIAYATLPYLLVDMYVRGAFAETWALALLPIVFSSARHLTERKTVGSLGAMGVALGALLMAHLAIALFAVPFAALYALIHGVHLHTDQTIAAPSGRSIGAEDEAHLQHADRDQRAAVGQITRLGAALILGLALSAIYWLPALGEIGLVSAQSLTGGFFDYRNHFHRTADLVQRSLLYDYRLAPGFRAGLVQVVISALGLVATLRVGQMRRSSVFFAVVLAISLGMQSERSSLLWERLPLLSYVLFPWRLLTLAGLASAYLAGALGSALFPVLAPKHFTLRRILANCLFGLLITILCATSLSSIDEPEMVAAQDVVTTAVMRQFERHRALIAASTSGVYLPRTSGVGPIAYTRLPQNPDPVPRPVHISVEAASPTALA
ncbi:MAG: glycosyltransferase family 39 protein, partial [Chloroflexi bacterium]|nr:glycosyltransferase family 39 protein [Chloroflexota bacterium]